MKKLTLIICMGWMFHMVSFAQQDTTANRIVVVENEYNPIVMDASKLMVLPKIEDPSVPKSDIDYATTIQPITGWDNQAMAPLQRNWGKDNVYRGYISGAYGNRGNVDATARYQWENEKNLLNLSALLKGWNGPVIGVDGENWDSRYYRSNIQAHYTGRFNQMNFRIGGCFGSQVFNYMPDVMEKYISDKQHFTTAKAYVGIGSNQPDKSFKYSLEVGFRLLDRKYSLANDMLHEMIPMGKGNEKNPYIDGLVGLSMKEHHLIGVAFSLNHFAYSDNILHNNTSMEFNPYYEWKEEAWKLRLGAHLDIWKHSNNSLNMSPDVQMEYLFSDSYVLYANANGGRSFSSIRDLTMLTPYWRLSNNVWEPTYVPLNVSAGLKASPADGFWFNLSGGYQIRNNDVCLYLSSYHSYMNASVIRADNKVAYANAELKYDYKDYLSLSAKGSYYKWSTDAQEENLVLALKPELEVALWAEGRIAKGLRLGMGYDYVKRSYDTFHNVSNLHARISYDFQKHIQLFIKGQNLLDSEYCETTGYPAQGMSVLAGLSYRF